MENSQDSPLRLILRETVLVANFLALLKEEERVLNDGDADALESIIQKKQLAIIGLHAIESERSGVFLRLNIVPAKDGERSFLMAPAGSTELDQAWGQLLEVVSQVYEQHELNGALITAYQQKTSSALGVLLHSHNELSLYNRGGTASPFSARRLVDSA